MKNNLLIKTLTIGVISLFVGASVVSGNFNDIVQNKNEVEIRNRHSSLEQEILFSDDFDDNDKDLDIWTETWTNGIWEETNQRAEFQTNENDPSNLVGIESKPISASITTDTPLEVACQMISYISNYGGYVGRIYLKIVDNNDNYIYLRYCRNPNTFEVADSTGTSKVLFYSDETTTPWDVELEIYCDRYKAIAKGYDSGWIENSVFLGCSEFKVQLYLWCNGDYPSFWWRAGFDNIIVRGQRFNPSAAIIIGRLDHLNVEDDYISFEAIRIRCLQLNPFEYRWFTSGDQITISKTYLGILNPMFILSICRMY